MDPALDSRVDFSSTTSRCQGPFRACPSRRATWSPPRCSTRRPAASWPRVAGPTAFMETESTCLADSWCVASGDPRESPHSAATPSPTSSKPSPCLLGCASFFPFAAIPRLRFELRGRACGRPTRRGALAFIRYRRIARDGLRGNRLRHRRSVRCGCPGLARQPRDRMRVSLRARGRRARVPREGSQWHVRI